MNSLRRFFAVTALTLTFSLTALADGTMDTPKTPPPPVTTSCGEMDTPVVPGGETDTGVTTGGAVDPVTGAVLDLMLSVLSLI